MLQTRDPFADLAQFTVIRENKTKQCLKRISQMTNFNFNFPATSVLRGFALTLTAAVDSAQLAPVDDTVTSPRISARFCAKYAPFTALQGTHSQLRHIKFELR
jgi:hypothetical protein